MVRNHWNGLYRDVLYLSNLQILKFLSQLLIITDETQNDKIYINQKHNEFIPVLVRLGGFRGSDAEGYVEALGINGA